MTCFFKKEGLRNELMNRGLTIEKTAELTGISYESLKECFDNDREMTANELIAIIEKVKIPIEKVIYKAPGEDGAEVVEWDEEKVMSKEYALSVIHRLKVFCRWLYFRPKEKPFNCEADFVATYKELNGLKEFIEKAKE